MAPDEIFGQNLTVFFRYRLYLNQVRILGLYLCIVISFLYVFWLFFSILQQWLRYTGCPNYFIEDLRLKTGLKHYGHKIVRKFKLIICTLGLIIHSIAKLNKSVLTLLIKTYIGIV